MKEKSKNQKKLLDICLFLLGTMVAAFSFNLFILPLNIVSGTSGIAVILNHYFGWKPSTIIFIIYMIILILSFLLMGPKKTKASIIGSILYPIFVELTSKLTGYINISDIEPIVLAVCGAIVNGVGLGMVYKTGYNTGGSDVITQILNKYFKKPIGTCTLLLNSVVVILALITFGLKSCIYSIIVIYITSMLIDRVMIGISSSKCFQVITEHETEVKKFLQSKLSHGVTVIPARGGYTGNVVKMIMCIIPTGEYVSVKEGILAIDEHALILVSDVYETVGSK